MRRVDLTSEWLTNWKPRRQEEIADRRCRGLLVRGGPSGGKTFCYWGDVPDEKTGQVRRGRVTLARWAVDGGGGALSLGAARERFLELKGAKRAQVDGTAQATVAQIAEGYRRDVLARRERADEAFAVIRTHVIDAQPDPKRPPFGAWVASAIRPVDVAALVRFAKEPRAVEVTTKAGGKFQRRLGGERVAAVTLRDLKAIFAHAVETGALEMSPAAVMRSRSFGLEATSRARVLDANEIKALFDALDLTALLDGTAKPKRVSAAVRLGIAFQLYTPLRSQSIIGARWEEVDFDEALWTVPVDRLKLKARDRKEARPFEVPLCKTAVAILQKLRELAGDSPWVLASPLPVEPEAGQPRPEPRHVEEKALIRAVSRLQSTGRLSFGSRITVHDLRRTWRTLAMDLGVDHVVAERSLGHVAVLRAAGFSGAADTYGRAQLVEQRAAAGELVASALDRIRLGKAAGVVPLAGKRRRSAAS